MNPFAWWRNRRTLAICNRYRARVGLRPLTRI